MANLETLFIEVNGNAEKAKGGIDSLITSLSALGSKVDEICGKFKDLSKSIRSVSRIKQVKLPTVSDITTATKSAGKSTGITEGAGKYSPGFTQTASEIQKAANVGSNAMNQLSASTNNVTESVNKASVSTKKFGGTLSAIGRIAKTLLIRTALKALMKAFSNAWTAAYNYSKEMGGEFATNVEKLRGAISGTAINIVTAFAPALNAIVPIVNVLASAIKFLCDQITALFQLLGMSSELFGASAEEINKYADASGKGGSKNKELLASFDELNVIQSSGGGGGGNGGSAVNFSYLTDMVSDEMAKLQMIVGTSLIGIGLILAFTGHIPLGVGMIALGAAAIVKTVTNDWGKLSDDTKNEIIKITAIASGAMLALGVILAFSGANVPLGIALIAAGVATFASVLAITWDTLPEKTKETLTKIGQYALGAGALGLGVALLLMGNLPLGLSLLAVAGYNIGTAAGLNLEPFKEAVFDVLGQIGDFFARTWDSIKEGAANIWTSVESELSGAWENIKLAAAAGWQSVKSFIEKNTGINIDKTWNQVTSSMSTAWDNVKTSVSDAWKEVKKWNEANPTIESKFQSATNFLKEEFEKISTNIKTAWEDVKQWWSSFPPIKTIWNSTLKWLETAWGDVKTAVEDAWKKVDRWRTVTWSNFSQAWDDIKNRLSNRWDIIKKSVEDAYQKVVNWMLAAWSDFADWDTIKQSLIDVWDSISLHVYYAWETFKNWVNAKWSDIRGSWTTIQSELNLIWSTVKNHVSDAWEQVQKWAGFTWGNISSAWTNIKTQLKDVWRGIGDSVSSAFAQASAWAATGYGSAVYCIEQAWGGLKTWFKNNVTDPIANSFKSAINTIIGWLNTVIHGLNSIGHIKYNGLNVDLPFGAGSVQLIPKIDKTLWSLGDIPELATGGFVDAGDLFLANEQGAELVGSMNGRTTVANQQQIIEGIRSGVESANAEQNELLRQQNQLLRGILEKEFKIGVGASFGRAAKQSIDMYNSLVGG